MVGIFLVYHSKIITDGIKKLAMQIVSEINLAIAVETFDGIIGTDVTRILNVVKSVYFKDGVIVIFDLGSALRNANMAMEFLNTSKKGKVTIVDCPIVEGSVMAAVESRIGKNIGEIE